VVITDCDYHHPQKLWMSFFDAAGDYRMFVANDLIIVGRDFDTAISV